MNPNTNDPFHLISSLRYTFPSRVKADLQQVLKLYPSLNPIVAAVPGDPYGTQCVSLSGTIPISFRGATYNIPVQLWIVQTYPSTYPLAFVIPTPTMMIKPGHQHVDVSGRCYFPYLSNWKKDFSNLSGLIGEMIRAFSVDPPAREKPQAPKEPSPPSYHPPPSISQSEPRLPY